MQGGRRCAIRVSSEANMSVIVMVSRVRDLGKNDEGVEIQGGTPIA